MADNAAALTGRGSQPLWNGWIRRFGRKGLDIAFPAHCPGCGAGTGEPGALCGPCWRAMPFVTRPFCERLGLPFATDIGGPLLSPAAIARPPAFDRARAVALHEGQARDFVHLLKFSDRLDLVRPMGRLMAGAGREVLVDADVLVPVPLHWTRLLRRRYNQSALLADAIAGICDLPVAHEALRRRKRTRPQVGLTQNERAANLSGAIVVPAAMKPVVDGRHVVVVDDVATTRATLNACAGALRRAGAKQIDVLTFTLVAHSGPMPI